MDPKEKDLIQVPAELLKSLVASVENFEKHVTQLRNGNVSLSTEIEQLKDSSGGRFHRFLKLPNEIRSIIWNFALTTPQVHIVTDVLVSRSQVNIVMQACREARVQGERLQLTYFERVDFDNSNLYVPFYTPVKNYMNLEVDTLWLAHPDMFPLHLEIFAPGIEEQILPNYEFREAPPHHRLKRLAIPFASWVDPDESKALVELVGITRNASGSAEVLRRLHGLQELLIVVGDEATIAAAMTQRNILFITPERRPVAALPQSFKFAEEKPDDLDLEIEKKAIWNSWDLMAERLEKILHHFKKRRTESRKFEIEVNGETPEELESWDDFFDLEGWQIPKVRYVEAVSEELPKQWLRSKNHYW